MKLHLVLTTRGSGLKTVGSVSPVRIVATRSYKRCLKSNTERYCASLFGAASSYEVAWTQQRNMTRESSDRTCWSRAHVPVRLSTTRSLSCTSMRVRKPRRRSSADGERVWKNGRGRATDSSSSSSSSSASSSSASNYKIRPECIYRLRLETENEKKQR